ncbi:Anaphase-promoting complex, cyclosome, subunit 3 [Gimesia panareensis]|nr:Anaphase-promoting complex, cyclosome, subunit 3 [Gimesia panareensis]
MKNLTILLLSFLVLCVESAVQAQPSPAAEAKAKASPPWETPVDLVLYAARQYKDHSVRDFMLKDISESLAHAGDMKQALEVTQEIEDSEEKDVARYRIAAALSQQGNLNQSLELIRKIKDPNGRTYTRMKIASALGKKGKTQEALKVIQVIERPASQVDAYCELASTLAKSGDQKQAQAILKQAQDVVEKMDDPLSDDIRSELRDLELMLLAATDKKQIQEILKKMIAFGDKDLDLKQVRKRVATQTRIAAALAEAGEVEQALEIVDQIAEWNLRAPALKSIARALVSMGKIKQAQEVIQRNAVIEELAQKVDHPELSSIRFERATTLKTISIALADRGDLKQALQIARTIKNKSSKALALQHIASHFAEEGEFEQAFQVSDLITLKQVRSETSGSIALALAKSGEIKRALHIVEQIEDPFIADRRRPSNKSPVIVLRTMTLCKLSISLPGLKLPETGPKRFSKSPRSKPGWETQKPL